MQKPADGYNGAHIVVTDTDNTEWLGITATCPACNRHCKPIKAKELHVVTFIDRASGAFAGNLQARSINGKPSYRYVDIKKHSMDADSLKIVGLCLMPLPPHVGEYDKFEVTSRYTDKDSFLLQAVLRFCPRPDLQKEHHGEVIKFIRQ